MNMKNNNMNENIMTTTTNQNEKKGFSSYSYELIDNIRELSNKIFPNEKDIKEEDARDDMAINKELFRTCAIAIIKDMNQLERKNFKENSGDFKNVLYLSLEKVDIPLEDKNSIKIKIDSITPEDYLLQSSITEKLDLLDIDSDVCKMSETLYETYKDNQDVFEAHSYLNLTEK